MGDGCAKTGLPPAVDASIGRIDGPFGPLAYYHDPSGSGTPVVLVHSINAAASAFEMRPLFISLRGRRPVYMPDLPGFGLSDRSARRYEPRVFTDAVQAVIGRALEETGASSVQLVGLSLSSEFAARAVSEQPRRVDRLVLITPTGFSRGADALREPGRTRELPGFAFIFEGRPWSRPLFDLLTREVSVRYVLRRIYGAREVDEDMVAYDVMTAAQPGAHHAPLAFLSGRLFSRDIRTVYESLELPVWVPHGTRGDFKDFSETGWAEARGHWRFEPFASGALPHYQLPEHFMRSLERFLEIA